jgi:hypothetical protein
MRYWRFNKEEKMNNSMNHKELIHSDFQIKEVEAVVRRDAFTTIHVYVPPYETNILRNLFGRENVTVFERPSKTTITPEQEYDRLCAKYGHEVVAKVFGEDDGDRLMEIVEGLMKEGQLPAQEKALEGSLEQATPHQDPPEAKGAKKR